MSLISETFGIVVLFKVKITDSKTILSINDALELSNQCLDLLVYDNSPIAMEQRSHFAYKRLNIRYIHDYSNSGVSRAYNLGAQQAKNMLNKKWVLLLDQDTTFAKNIFGEFTKAISSNPEIKLFSPMLFTFNNIIFSPCRYYFKRGFPLKSIKSGTSTLKGISPVNSGMLIDLRTFFNVGMYNTAIRLDFSDFQFIDRFKKKHSDFFVINSVAWQDFSNHETNVYKLNNRYSFFCEGAKNIDKYTILDYIEYFIVVLMRAVTLSYRTKSVIYFKTFFNYYIKN